jgi:hypothetical protein
MTHSSKNNIPSFGQGSVNRYSGIHGMGKYLDTGYRAGKNKLPPSYTRGWKSFYKDYWSIDFKNMRTYINVFVDGSNGWQDLIDDLKEYKTIEVHLSGGIDSQFLCLMLQKLKIPFHALTFKYDNDFNDWEVDSATKFCRKNNIKHYIKTFNLLDFFESGEYEYYTDLAECASPQYATFFKMYTLTNADMIIADGSPPVVLLDDNDLNHVEAEIKWVDLKDHAKKIKHHGVQTIGEHNYPIICYGTNANIGSQLRFIEKIKQPCITNLCYYSPKILLEGCNKVIEYQKEYKIKNPNDLRYPYFFEKHKLYKIAYDLDLPKVNDLTGFEKLKKYFNHIYNKNDYFNEVYRQPLQEKYPNSMYDTCIGGVLDVLL